MKGGVFMFGKILRNSTLALIYSAGVMVLILNALEAWGYVDQTIRERKKPETSERSESDEELCERPDRIWDLCSGQSGRNSGWIRHMVLRNCLSQILRKPSGFFFYFFFARKKRGLIVSKHRKKKALPYAPFLRWVKETYGISLPPETEVYMENLRNLKPTQTIIQTPRGYYIYKEPTSR